jgi:DNA-directed RNA polymerase subunit RPC12/RpoP
MIKYFCDDCGAALGEHDNIAGQLDMTGHVYCHECRKKRADLYKPVIYAKEVTEKELHFPNFRAKI